MAATHVTDVRQPDSINRIFSLHKNLEAKTNCPCRMFIVRKKKLKNTNEIPIIAFSFFRHTSEARFHYRDPSSPLRNRGPKRKKNWHPRYLHPLNKRLLFQLNMDYDWWLLTVNAPSCQLIKTVKNFIYRQSLCPVLLAELNNWMIPFFFRIEWPEKMI